MGQQRSLDMYARSAVNGNASAAHASICGFVALPFLVGLCLHACVYMLVAYISAGAQLTYSKINILSPYKSQVIQVCRCRGRSQHSLCLRSLRPGVVVTPNVV